MRQEIAPVREPESLRVRDVLRYSPSAEIRARVLTVPQLLLVDAQRGIEDLPFLRIRVQVLPHPTSRLPAHWDRRGVQQWRATARRQSFTRFQEGAIFAVHYKGHY